MKPAPPVTRSFCIRLAQSTFSRALRSRSYWFAGRDKHAMIWRMRGIILAGGTGSRLHPITLGISKQLVPVYDKPMIYYPLSTLILAGIRDILIITTPHDAEQFQRLLGDGCAIRRQHHVQAAASPDGLAQAFILGAEHIGNEPVALVLGDNIFYGQGMGTQLRRFTDIEGGAVFGYWVQDPDSLRCRGVRRQRTRRSPWKRSRRSREATTPFPDCISTTTTSLTSPRTSSLPPAANSRSPTSTAPTWNAASCRLKSFPAARHGWTPGRSTTSTTRPTSFVPWRTARA